MLSYDFLMLKELHINSNVFHIHRQDRESVARDAQDQRPTHQTPNIKAPHGAAAPPALAERQRPHLRQGLHAPAQSPLHLWYAGRRLDRLGQVLHPSAAGRRHLPLWVPFGREEGRRGSRLGVGGHAVRGGWRGKGLGEHASVLDHMREHGA